MTSAACHALPLSDNEWSAIDRPSVASATATLTGFDRSRRFRYGDDVTVVVITAPPAPPPWFEAIFGRIEHLLALPQDWDSYGGRPIDPKRVAHAVRILAEVMDNQTPLPALVPTHSGGVQLEWHQGQIDLEMEIVSPSRVVVDFEDLETGESWEEELTSDLRRAREAVEVLSRRSGTEWQ